MKEEKTKNKKKVLYFVALAISVLLLIAATVLTVYFVTQGQDEVLDNPPAVEDPDQNNDPKPPVEDPSGPTGGEDVVKFVAPVSYTDATPFNEIYTNQTVGWSYRHRAVDFAAEAGTNVCAMADGTVSTVSMNETTGNYIVVDHGDGLKTLYRFVEPKEGLAAGAKVKKGDVIATVAAAYGSEAEDGAHLHLEIELNGVKKDPAEYFDIVSSEK